MKERAIAKDEFGNKVLIVEYEDGGLSFTDLHTDGRVLLTPKFAKELARKLNAWAEKKARGK